MIKQAGILAVGAAFAWAAPAEGRLVYETTASHAIVVARDDGSGGRVVAHGTSPVVSPDGSRIAFETGGDLYVVSSRGGAPKLLRRHVFSPIAYAPVTWASGSRRLVTGDRDHPSAVLVDVVRDRRRNVALDGVLGYGGASFSPDARRLIIDNAYERGDELREYRSSGRDLGHVVDGSDPVWGKRGVAFARTKKVYFRTALHSKSRLVARAMGARMELVGWSRDGRTLLAADRTADRRRAVLVRPAAGVVRLSQPFSLITALSRSGRQVLGEADGNVIVARLDGTVSVLARGARSPSWTH